MSVHVAGLNSMIKNERRYIADELTSVPWTLAQLRKSEIGLKPNGLKVFSCFACGGGSSMGYRLAGYTCLGGVEIDPKIAAMYLRNLNPQFFFTMPVQDFNRIKPHQLPRELFELDILDGSPPCSSFSMAGDREKRWQVKKKFKEGQAEQVLDDLFFHFIQTARKLNPRVVVAENVKGLISGTARGYVKEIFKRFDAIGYDCQLFLLNAARMGVPQRRERTFFVARRRDQDFPELILNFREKEISAYEATEGQLDGYLCGKANLRRTKKGLRPLWDTRTMPAPTATASGLYFRERESEDWKTTGSLANIRLQSFPDDYDSLGVRPVFVTGMSVPPLMLQRLAHEIYLQWFGRKEVTQGALFQTQHSDQASLQTP